MLIYSEMLPHGATDPHGSAHRAERAPNRFAARKERKRLMIKKKGGRGVMEKAVFPKQVVKGSINR